MSTERVVTDNELIAEFMGLKHRKEFGPLTGFLAGRGVPSGFF